MQIHIFSQIQLVFKRETQGNRACSHSPVVEKKREHTFVIGYISKTSEKRIWRCSNGQWQKIKVLLIRHSSFFYTALSFLLLILLRVFDIGRDVLQNYVSSRWGVFLHFLSCSISGSRNHFQTTKCTSCRMRRRDIAFVACGHLLYCERCQRRFRHCPACGTKIKAWVKVLWD